MAKKHPSTRAFERTEQGVTDPDLRDEFETKVNRARAPKADPEFTRILEQQRREDDIDAGI